MYMARRILVFWFFLWLSGVAQAGSYFEMDLEALMDVTVTSLSKREQKLLDSAAALYVISGDDIRRSGATRIGEVLRMVPGLMVAQNNAWIWTISSRGRSFNPTWENKLLVMIDGQSVYSPAFSGTLWDTVNLFMEDIDRVEILRGPGGSTWGSNAVNGIVNIITKSADKTTGAMIRARVGEEEKGAGAFRFGGEFSPGNFYRAYSRVQRIEEHDTGDILDTKSIGFRTDCTPTPESSFSFSGDFFTGISDGITSYPDLEKREQTLFAVREDLDQLRLNSFSTYQFSEGKVLSLQLGYIKDKRVSDSFGLETEQAEVEINFQFAPLAHHLVQIGFGYHFAGLDIATPFEPWIDAFKQKHADHLFSGFFSDTIELADGRCTVALGSKFEYMDNLGFEFSPSARISFKIDEDNMFWGAASRTIRTPSYLERFVVLHEGLINMADDSSFPFDIMRLSMIGNQNLKEEDSRSFELGYRLVTPLGFILDTSVFYTRYKDLMDANLLGFRPSNDIVPHLEAVMQFENLRQASVWGGEIALTWEAASWLMLRGWYAYCDENYKERDANGGFAAVEVYGDSSPVHQFFLRSSLTLPHEVELDLMFRHISKLSGLNIPAYTTLDARLGFRPSKNIEFCLIGKNLLEKEHREMGNHLAYGTPSMLRRAVLCQVQMEF